MLAIMRVLYKRVAAALGYIERLRKVKRRQLEKENSVKFSQKKNKKKKFF